MLLPRLRDCIYYRAGQKLITRGYLARARTAVMEELRILQRLIDEELIEAPSSPEG